MLRSRGRGVIRPERNGCTRDVFAGVQRAMKRGKMGGRRGTGTDRHPKGENCTATPADGEEGEYHIVLKSKMIHQEKEKNS